MYLQVADIKTGSISLSKYGLEEATSKLDLTNEVGVSRNVNAVLYLEFSRIGGLSVCSRTGPNQADY